MAECKRLEYAGKKREDYGKTKKRKGTNYTDARDSFITDRTLKTQEVWLLESIL